MYKYNIMTDIASAKVNLDKLQEDINASPIGVSLDNISLDENIITITFISTLDDAQKNNLDSLVLNHDGELIPEEINTTGVLSGPFASKIVDGGKLYRRKHGVRESVPGNSTKIIKFTVPYDVAKIDEVEIVNCSAEDTVDLKVLDSIYGDYTLAMTGTAAPNHVLNQFGFNVNLSDIYYTDASNYDAELNIGMQIEITYKNNEPDTKSIGINFVLHEVKAIT